MNILRRSSLFLLGLVVLVLLVPLSFTAFAAGTSTICYGPSAASCPNTPVDMGTISISPNSNLGVQIYNGSTGTDRVTASLTRTVGSSGNQITEIYPTNASGSPIQIYNFTLFQSGSTAIVGLHCPATTVELDSTLQIHDQLAISMTLFIRCAPGGAPVLSVSDVGVNPPNAGNVYANGVTITGIIPVYNAIVPDSGMSGALLFLKNIGTQNNLYSNTPTVTGAGFSISGGSLASPLPPGTQSQFALSCTGTGTGTLTIVSDTNLTDGSGAPVITQNTSIPLQCLAPPVGVGRVGLYFGGIGPAFPDGTIIAMAKGELDVVTNNRSFAATNNGNPGTDVMLTSMPTISGSDDANGLIVRLAVGYGVPAAYPLDLGGPGGYTRLIEARCSANATTFESRTVTMPNTGSHTPATFTFTCGA